jgi:prepilin-type N-terminal cleavage/methylation domain-containing protein
MTTRTPLCRAAAFTMVEMLTVIAIIAILAGILIPTVMKAQKIIKQNATRSEVMSIGMAMTAYFNEWGVYPPDSTPDDASIQSAERNLNPAECIVYYLGKKFRTSDGYTRNSGPYYDFDARRLVDDNADGQPVYTDLLGPREGVSYYRFDNNDDDDGDQTNWHTNYEPDGSAPDYNHHGINVTNINKTKVDIWSAGWDGKDPISGFGNTPYSPPPTADNITSLDADDIGNW